MNDAPSTHPGLPSGLTLGEGPRWIDHGRDSGLWWVDIIAGKLFHRPNQDQVHCWELLEQVGMVGALAPSHRGGLILATQRGWQFFDPATGICQAITDPTPSNEVRFNDGAVDPAGRFVAGTMPLDMPTGAGALWALKLTVVADNCCPA